MFGLKDPSTKLLFNLNLLHSLFFDVVSIAKMRSDSMMLII